MPDGHFFQLIELPLNNFFKAEICFETETLHCRSCLLQDTLAISSCAKTCSKTYRLLHITNAPSTWHCRSPGRTGNTALLPAQPDTERFRSNPMTSMAIFHGAPRGDTADQADANVIQYGASASVVAFPNRLMTFRGFPLFC